VYLYEGFGFSMILAEKNESLEFAADCCIGSPDMSFPSQHYPAAIGQGELGWSRNY